MTTTITAPKVGAKVSVDHPKHQERLAGFLRRCGTVPV